MAGLGIMAGSSLRGSYSRVGLILVALLLGAIAVANCNTDIANNSPYYIQVTDVSTPQAYTWAPNFTALFAWLPGSDGTVPDSRTFFFEYFTSSPSDTSTSVSGNKVVFAMTTVFVNGTINFFQPPAATSNSTPSGYVGYSVSYS
ncbi:unnamed protein product [Calypogeia fissa]